MRLTFRFKSAFTTPEVLVTIVIAICITVMAVPVINRYIARDKVSDAIIATQPLKDLINANIVEHKSTKHSGVGFPLPERLNRYIVKYEIKPNGTIQIETTLSANEVTLILTPQYDTTTQAIAWKCAVNDQSKNDMVPNECRI